MQERERRCLSCDTEEPTSSIDLLLNLSLSHRFEHSTRSLPAYSLTRFLTLLLPNNFDLPFQSFFAHSLACLLSHNFAYLQFRSLTHSITHSLTHSPMRQLAFFSSLFVTISQKLCPIVLAFFWFFWAHSLTRSLLLVNSLAVCCFLTHSLSLTV